MNIKYSLLVLCTALLIGSGCDNGVISALGSGSRMENPSSVSGGSSYVATNTYAIAWQDGSRVGINNSYETGDYLELSTDSSRDPWDLVYTAGDTGTGEDHIKIPFDGHAYEIIVKFRGRGFSNTSDYWSNWVVVNCNSGGNIHGMHDVGLADYSSFEASVVVVATSADATVKHRMKRNGSNGTTEWFEAWSMTLIKH